MHLHHFLSPHSHHQYLYYQLFFTNLPHPFYYHLVIDHLPLRFYQNCLDQQIFLQLCLFIRFKVDHLKISLHFLNHHHYHLQSLFLKILQSIHYHLDFLEIHLDFITRLFQRFFHPYHLGYPYFFHQALLLRFYQNLRDYVDSIFLFLFIELFPAFHLFLVLYNQDRPFLGLFIIFLPILCFHSTFYGPTRCQLSSYLHPFLNHSILLDLHSLHLLTIPFLQFHLQNPYPCRILLRQNPYHHLDFLKVHPIIHLIILRIQFLQIHYFNQFLHQHQYHQISILDLLLSLLFNKTL